MLKVTLALGLILAVLVAESTSQRFIQPTFRPPRPFPKPKPIRLVREVDQTTETAENIPVATIDALESLHRNVRSLDSPSAKRQGYSTSSGSRDTAGATHPGYNRRNTREIRLPGHLNPLRPKPLYPRPTFPATVPRIPIYARTARDIQFPGIRKPTHRDVIIPNWNPHVKTSPWDSLGGKRRHERSIDFNKDVSNEVEFMDLPHDRIERDIQIGGLPRKPTHRDVIIPNWNPHVKTNPWNSIVGRGRHGRSIDFIEEDINDAAFADQLHERVARDIQISGLPKKPTYRDVIIPNWNPHVKTNPWNSLGGRGRHGRSLDVTENTQLDEEFDHLSDNSLV